MSSCEEADSYEEAGNATNNWDVVVGAVIIIAGYVGAVRGSSAGDKVMEICSYPERLGAVLEGIDVRCQCGRSG